MDRQTARVLCLNNNPDELCKYLTRPQLCSMYKALYGLDVPPRRKPIDIAWSCWNYIADEKRTADLCKILT